MAPERKKRKTDLVLRSLPADEPASSMGWVQWIWPEIEQGLASGKKLKEVWEAARRDGLAISYPHFRVYISRLRRRQRVHSTVAEPLQPTKAASTAPDPDSRSAIHERPIDPLYNVRVQLEKKRNFHFEYNPFPDPEDDIK